MMEPLRVTFTFRAPVVRDSDYPLHLDALLAWCVADEAEARGLPEAWAVADDLGHLLARAESPSGEWVWQASELMFDAASERFWINAVRKADPVGFMEAMDRGWIDMRRPRGSLNTRSGSDRAYQWLTPYQWMERATAWCVGDRAQIEQALGRLSAIGKMTRNGWGLLATKKVESDPAAGEAWKRRFLPEGIQGQADASYESAMHCPRPPYWRKTAKIVGRLPLVEPDEKRWTATACRV